MTQAPVEVRVSPVYMHRRGNSRNRADETNTALPEQHYSKEETTTEILDAFLVNFNALLQTLSTGSAQLLGTIV